MTLTPQLIEDYPRRLAEDERGAATIDKYRRDLLRFYEFLPPDKAVDKAVARRGYHRQIPPRPAALLRISAAGQGRRQSRRAELEGAARRAQVRELLRQRHARLGQRPAHLRGPSRVAREVSQTPARGLLRRTARAAPSGVREARRDRAPRKKDSPHAHDGDDMLDRHPRIGARLRHSRGRPRGARRAHAQGQMPPHTLPGGARAQALALRGGASHSARPDIHRQDRQPRQPPPRMVRDEKARRARRTTCATSSRAPTTRSNATSRSSRTCSATAA